MSIPKFAKTIFAIVGAFSLGLAVLSALGALITLRAHPTNTLQKLTPDPAHVLAATDVDTAQLLALTNADRTKSGSAPLALDNGLVKSAQAKCSDMVANNYYDHVSPKGVKWSDFIQQQYKYYDLASENINVMWGDASASIVETSWMNSPGHKANIVDARFQRIGLAACLGTYNGNPAVFVVEHFLKPLTQQAAATLAPTAPTSPSNTIMQCALANSGATSTYIAAYNTAFSEYINYSTSHTVLNDPSWQTDTNNYKQYLNGNLKIEYANLQFDLSLKGCTATFSETLLV